MFVLPYIVACSPKFREDRRILVLVFYLGLAWTIFCGITRVFAGAHLLSDKPQVSRAHYSWVH